MAQDEENGRGQIVIKPIRRKKRGWAMLRVNSKANGQTGMARSGRHQEYAAVDSNVFVAYLDKDHPQQSKPKPLAHFGFNNQYTKSRIIVV